MCVLMCARVQTFLCKKYVRGVLLEYIWRMLRFLLWLALTRVAYWIHFLPLSIGFLSFAHILDCCCCRRRCVVAVLTGVYWCCYSFVLKNDAKEENTSACARKTRSTRMYPYEMKAKTHVFARSSYCLDANTTNRNGVERVENGDRHIVRYSRQVTIAVTAYTYRCMCVFYARYECVIVQAVSIFSAFSFCLWLSSLSAFAQHTGRCMNQSTTTY